MLSAACRVTREANTLTMLVRNGTKDDEALERAFAKGRTLEMEHEGLLIRVRLTDFSMRGHLVEWRGQISP